MRVAVFLIVSLWAAESRAQYRFDRFTTGNGLPQNTVSSIAQTDDGYLWFGTYDGLVRYDGVTFRVFDKGNTPAITSNQILSLVADGRALWMNAVEAALVRYAAGAFTMVTSSDGAPLTKVGRAEPTARGITVFQGGDPIWLLARDGTFVAPDPAALAEFTARDGTQWRLERGVLHRIKGDRTSQFAIDLKTDEFVVVLADTPAEGALVVAEVIRAGVEKLQIPHAKNTASAYVTIGIGLVAGPAAQGITPEAFVAAADRALYQSKHGGRNRVTLGDATTASS